MTPPNVDREKLVALRTQITTQLGACYITTCQHVICAPHREAVAAFERAVREDSIRAPAEPMVSVSELRAWAASVKEGPGTCQDAYENCADDILKICARAERQGGTPNQPTT